MRWYFSSADNPFSTIGVSKPASLNACCTCCAASEIIFTSLYLPQTRQGPFNSVWLNYVKSAAYGCRFLQTFLQFSVRLLTLNKSTRQSLLGILPSHNPKSEQSIAF